MDVAAIVARVRETGQVRCLLAPEAWEELEANGWVVVSCHSVGTRPDGRRWCMVRADKDAPYAGWTSIDTSNEES